MDACTCGGMSDLVTDLDLTIDQLLTQPGHSLELGPSTPLLRPRSRKKDSRRDKEEKKGIAPGLLGR